MTTKQNDWVSVRFSLGSHLSANLEDRWHSIDEAARIFANVFDAAKAAGGQRVRLYTESIDVEVQRQLSDEEQADFDAKKKTWTSDRQRIAQLEAELAKLKGGGQ